MSLPVVLTDHAANEFDAAADWYDEKAGMGAEFTAQIRTVMTQIGQMPESHQILHRDVRRARIKKFPYNLYYRVKNDRVEVIALLHSRRDASVWKDRG